jgi:arylsulfatase A-like enzyme
VERGVRFVQLYHTNWDHHGGPTENLETHLPQICREIDRPCAALVADLRRRGLLDDTIVVWGGEFGRTPMGEVRESTGRNHHIDAFTMWFAGGGTKPGVTYGKTDDYCYNVTTPDEHVHVHDLNATILHLMGIDHLRLTYPYQGRDFRLTDIHGAVVKGILA